MPTSVSSEFNQLALADTPNAVPWARRHVVDVLRRWQVPPKLIDTAQLLVSELMTNALPKRTDKELAAAYSILESVGTITLTLRLDGPQLLVMVHDYQPQLPVLKQVGLDAENGRGVFLVAHMSSRWGYYFASAGAKVVWSELLLTASTVEEPKSVASVQESPLPRSDQATPLLVARTLVGLRGL
ncbi:ATP-binding protein [Kitasatospora sp. NPDC101447]|uniref:ATP-binding protein n=1 Tax=Kitasatospora sp. NPDC101447 TaxID=3364102 RepID=UPI003810704E